MAYIHIEGHNFETPDYEKASEDVPEGALVTRLAGGGVEQTDASSHDSVSGVALNLEAGDQIASHEYDYNTGIDNFVYQPQGNKSSSDMFPNSDDRVPIGGQEPTAHPIPNTIKDNGTDPAPSINRNNVVGVAAVGANEQDEIQGRIVEEGYTDDAGTTYGRSSAGDFVALGLAEEAVSSYDEPVRVRRLGLGLP